MSTNIKLKRSAVQGKIPLTTDLELGELAINTFDGKLYMKKDDGTEAIVDITAGGATIGDATITFTGDSVIIPSGSFSLNDSTNTAIALAVNTAAIDITESQISDFGTYLPTADFTATANTWLATRSTTNLSEGTNLYYTTARANTAIDARVTQSFVNALNVDADTLDSLNSTQFLRSDIDDTLSGSLTVNGEVDVGDSTLKTESGSTTSTTQTSIASFAASSYSSGKFVIQASDSVSGEVHVTELLIVHDGTTASATEYGTIHTGAAQLATYDVDINTGNVRILATATSTNSTTYKVTENLITA